MNNQFRSLHNDLLYDVSWLFGHDMHINKRNGRIDTNMPRETTLDIDKYLTACVIYNIRPHDMVLEDING